MVAEQRYHNQATSNEDMYESKMVLHNQAVPKATIAFLKELLTISDEARRFVVLSLDTKQCNPSLSHPKQDDVSVTYMPGHCHALSIICQQ